MKNYAKRFLALFLCLAMILPMIPLQIATAANEEVPDPIEIQAEDENYVYLYKWSRDSWSACGANENVKGSWPTYNDLVSREYFDKSNVPYLTFTVEAPADGEYELSGSYNYGAAADSKHFLTFIVNGGGEGNVYKSERSDSGVAGSNTVTEPVKVSLKKGINTVYCVVMTKDQLKGNDGWANVDKFVIDGRLTAVKVNTQTLNTGNATYLNLYSDRRDSGVGGSKNGTPATDKISIADLGDIEKLAKTPFVSVTVYAEKAGYYDITLDVAGTLNKTPNAIGVVVDGTPHAAKFYKHSDYKNGDTVINWNTLGVHRADCSLYLEAGVHTIAFTMMLPVDAAQAEGYSYSWTDLGKVILNGGLVRTDVQVNPLTGEQSVEAEGSYTVINRYNRNSTTDRNYFGYGNLNGANISDNQTYADIEANGLDTTKNAMATVFVYAPADGTYSVGVRAATTISGLWDSSTSSWTTTPWYTIVVNEKDVYKAMNQTQNGWNTNSQTIEVTLKKGINAISCVTLVKDLVAEGNCWSDLDCIFVDGELLVMSGIDFDSYQFSSINAGDKDSVIWNRYGNEGGDASGNEVGNGWHVYDQTLAEIKADGLNPSKTAFVGFYVEAPADGEYWISANGYLRWDNAWVDDAWKETPYGTFVVNDGDIYTANYTDGNAKTQDTMPVKVTLKKGINTIKFVPITKNDALGSVSWYNVNALNIDGRLTGVSKSLLTLKPSDGVVYKYSNIDSGSGKLGGSDNNWISTNGITTSTVKAEDLENIPSSSVTVTAPKNGYYDVELLYNAKVNDYKNRAVVLLVDGKVKTGDIQYNPAEINNDSASAKSIISVYLTEGDHVLSFITQIPTVENASYDYWLDMKSIVLGGGLTKAEVQRDPTKPTVVPTPEPTPDKNNTSKIEAEDQEYTAWNRFSATENNGGNTLVGNGNPTDNVSLAQLMADPSIDLSTSSYVSFIVNAPSDGKYAMRFRYLIHSSESFSDFPDGKTPYAVFVVNGKVYTANHLGKNGWVTSTAWLDEVELKEGNNTVYVIPLIREVMDMGYNWANPDYLEIEGRLSAVKIEDAGTTPDPEPTPDPEIPDLSQFDRIEAEDKTLTIWNRYGNDGSGEPEAGKYVGGAWQDSNQTVESIKANGLQPARTAHIMFFVNAPEDGEYWIAGTGYLQMDAYWNKDTNTWTNHPYAAFVVNGSTVYTSEYTGNNASIVDAAVKVTLKKGINTIAFVPKPNDSAIDGNSGWFNVDCLKIENSLSSVSNAILNVKPSDGTVYQYGNINSDSGILGGCVNSWISENGTLVSDVKPSILNKIPSTSYTVNAPVDGYYTVSLKYAATVNGYANRSLALLVDGNVQSIDVWYDKAQIGNESAAGRYTVSVYLTAGEHVLSMTMQLPKSATSEYGYWNDMYEIIFGGGLTLAETQQDPTTVPDPDHSDVKPDKENSSKIEAEDKEYTVWNRFNSAGNYGENASGGQLVEHGNPTDNVSLKQLLANPNIDLSSTSYVSFTVNAPYDGEFALRFRYMIHSADSFSDFPEGKTPYAVFVVNGKVYTANHLGKNGWITSTEWIDNVELKSGNNTVYVIPLIREVMDMGYDYANPDYLEIEGRLSAVKVENAGSGDDDDEPKQTIVEAEDKNYSVWNKYQSVSGYDSNASGGYYIENAWGLSNVNFKDLKEGVNLDGTAYIKIIVDAPADGDYLFSARYMFRINAQEGASDFTTGTPYLTFFANGKAYKSENHSKNGWLTNTDEVSITLKKGKNELYVIPLTSDQEQLFGSCWANIDCVRMDGSLSAVKTDYVDNSDRNRVEAEDQNYTGWNSYHNTETRNDYSNGSVAAGSHAGNNIYLKDLVSGVDLGSTAYLTWNFNAPKAGYYKFAVRLVVSGKISGNFTDDHYVTFWVNDSKYYTAALSGSNGTLTDTVDVEIYLNKGDNEIVLIPLIKDVYDALGTAWANVDCLYYDEALTVNKQAVYTKLNAVNAEYFGYNPEDGRLMREDQSSAIQNNMTFDNLTQENINNISWVKYTVTADEAGTYRIGIGFQSGGTWPTEKIYTAMSVNKGAFQKVYFNHTESKHLVQLVYVDIELEKGENTILLTAALADWQLKGKSVLYIDHEYLNLPEGVYGNKKDETPAWTGDDKANISDSLDSVWGDTSGYQPNEKPDDNKPGNNNPGNNENNTQPNVTQPNEPSNPTQPSSNSNQSGNSGLVVVCILLVLLIGCGVAFIIFYTKRRNQQKSDEA